MSSNNNCFDIDEARTLITDPRYIIDEFVGSGAMACVYKVRERGTPNVYALKLLREEYRKREKFKEIFQREATHMRDLQYPNIVRFYKFVLEERSAYILMDYVEGEALTHYIRQARRIGKPIAIAKIVRIMAQTARAISYLHIEGFIHRDVKPGNILLIGENESAFLTDLGIAGAMDEPSLSGAGTPSYMPYEQQVRDPIDHTVDIYAFAIMLYELFTGEKPFAPDPGLPFEEARKAIVEMHRKDPIPSISERRSELPPIIDNFFEQALAKSPGERYADILDFARDIHEALLPLLPKDLRDFDRIQAQEAKRSVQRVEVEVPADSNRVILGGIIAILLIILLVTGGIWLNSQNVGTTATAPVIVEETAEVSESVVEASAIATLTATMPPTSTTISTALPTATIEITAEPTTILEDVSLNLVAEGVDAIAYGDDLNPALRYIASVRDGFVPLQFGEDVNAFRVEIALEETSLRENQEFGLAFRIQDEDNYLLFSVDSSNPEMLLSRIQNGERAVLQQTSLEDTIISTIILTARDNLIRIEVDNMLIQATDDTWTNGVVALWLPQSEPVPVVLSNLAISLIGGSATSNPVARIPDLQFLLEDIESLRATGDENSIVDCSQFIESYNRLDNHATLDNASIVERAGEFVSEAQSASTVIFTRCNLEPDNSAVEFSFSDYLDWETELDLIIADIETANGRP